MRTQKKHIYLAYFSLLCILWSCKEKKSEDVAPATIPERIEVTPNSTSIMIGGTAAFTIQYFDKMGVQAAPPSGTVWTSSNPAIATIDQQGIATGVSNGQVIIKAKLREAEATALLTVVLNNSQIATISLDATTKELLLNEKFTLTAVAKNNGGTTLTGKVFTWQSSNPAIAEVNAATGEVTAKGYGTAEIRALSEGIQSLPAMAQVIRIGTFSGANSQGTAKLKIENGVLKLQVSSNFSVSTGAPDLRIYLSNSANNNSALEIATLTQRAGSQTWNLPSGTSITGYRYALVWCKQFGGNYGIADLGN